MSPVGGLALTNSKSVHANGTPVYDYASVCKVWLQNVQQFKCLSCWNISDIVWTNINWTFAVTVTFEHNNSIFLLDAWVCYNVPPEHILHAKESEVQKI